MHWRAQNEHSTSRKRIVLLGAGAALALAAFATAVFQSRTGTSTPGMGSVKYETVRTFDADESDHESGYGSTTSAPAHSETKHFDAVKRD